MCRKYDVSRKPAAQGLRQQNTLAIANYNIYFFVTKYGSIKISAMEGSGSAAENTDSIRVLRRLLRYEPALRCPSQKSEAAVGRSLISRSQPTPERPLQGCVVSPI